MNAWDEFLNNYRRMLRRQELDRIWADARRPSVLATLNAIYADDYPQLPAETLVNTAAGFTGVRVPPPGQTGVGGS